MNKVFATYSCIVFLSALFAACDNGVSGETMPGPTPFKSERSPYFLNGTVIDGHGIPIADAEIHSMLKFSQPAMTVFRTPLKTMPSTNITFSMPNEGWATLKVFRLGTRELIATLIDGVLQPGNYVSVFDAGSLTNGFYVYQLITKENFTERLMLLQMVDISALVQTKPLTRTDAEGKFRLPQSLFGLDEEIAMTSEKGPDVIGKSYVDSLAIVVYQSGKRPFVQWMSVNKNGTMEHTYILQ
ncbi:MAG: hypothetical protein KA247_09005 [Bacteroidetes bacterium]|nr:hypothetical protein [Bacteroidota bacterium]